MKKYLLIFIVLTLSLNCTTKKPHIIFGKITALKGPVTLFDRQKARWQPLESLTDVYYGDSIHTSTDAELEITFENDNILKCAENTTVSFTSEDSRGCKTIIVSNVGGEVSSELKSLKNKNIAYRVVTPTGSADAEGTLFIVYYEPVPRITKVYVLHGHVRVFNPFQPVTPVVVEPGFHTVVAYQIVPIVPIPCNYGEFKKMHKILGPKKYKHYAVTFHIQPHVMLPGTPIVPVPFVPVPGRMHVKSGAGDFKCKIKGGPGAVILPGGSMRKGPAPMFSPGKPIKGRPGVIMAPGGPMKKKPAPGAPFIQKGGKGRKK